MTDILSRSYDNIGERVCSAVLSNGLQIRIVPKPGFKTSYAVFAVNYGGAAVRYELDGVKYDTPAGVAHFLEHKMFDLPGGDSAMAIMTSNGADPNAFTSSDMTAYYFECTDNFNENLKMLLHFVTTPYFTPETVEKEQGIIGQEISMCEDNPGITLYYNLLKMLYDHHPFRDKVIGTVSSIATITDETLYSCHSSFYTPANMVLCVEGDVDPEAVVRIAEAELCSESSPVPSPDYGEEESLLPVETRHCEEAEISAPQFYIGAKFRPEKGGKAQLRQRLVSQLALRVMVGTSSSFYTSLYASGLLNRDYEYEADYSAHTGTVIIGGESKDPEAVLSALSETVEAVRANGLDSEAFERAKKASFGSRLRALEDFESVCISCVTGIFNGYEALDSLAELDSVTIEECNAFISDTLAPERIAMSVITPKRS